MKLKQAFHPRVLLLIAGPVVLLLALVYNYSEYGYGLRTNATDSFLETPIGELPVGTVLFWGLLIYIIVRSIK